MDRKSIEQWDSPAGKSLSFCPTAGTCGKAYDAKILNGNESWMVKEWEPVWMMGIDVVWFMLIPIHIIELLMRFFRGSLFQPGDLGWFLYSFNILTTQVKCTGFTFKWNVYIASSTKNCPSTFLSKHGSSVMFCMHLYAFSCIVSF